MDANWLLPLLIMLPVVFAGVSLLIRSARTAVCFGAAGTWAVACCSLVVVWRVFSGGALYAAGNWFMLDALSAYHLLVMMAVFSVSALCAIGYLGREIAEGLFPDHIARRYGSLWFGSLAAMMLVLISGNLGIMWVGIEATTLLTAFLIRTHTSAAALEAMWKYLLMCSVGVALAFTGTLLIAASTGPAGLHGTEALLWTNLSAAACRLDPALLKAGFIFLVVGYGTKAGLAPMHNWLPDAHSQAPAPVSAIFSGFLLNTALYCILRCLPVVEAATGNVGWARDVLVVLGLLSILVAAAFVATQHDIKRLLAYSSVEHIGIITLGVGLGGIGVWAALFHMFGHSLGKTLVFCCAGRVGQVFGTHDMRRFSRLLRTSTAWGGGLLAGLLVLIGVAPFSLFISEFLVVKAAVDHGALVTAALLLAGLAIVFVTVLRRAIAMAWAPGAVEEEPQPARARDSLLVLAVLSVLLALGLCVPLWLGNMIDEAARLLGGLS